MLTPACERAVTETEYAVPLRKPLIVHAKAAVEQLRPPGLATAVYSRMSSLGEADQVTSNDRSEGTSLTSATGLGSAVDGATTRLATDGALLPILFSATTENRYS